MFLEGKNAKDLIEQDSRPLSSVQKEHLKKCLEIYRKNPIKEYLTSEEYKELIFEFTGHIVHSGETFGYNRAGSTEKEE